MTRAEINSRYRASPKGKATGRAYREANAAKLKTRRDAYRAQPEVIAHRKSTMAEKNAKRRAFLARYKLAAGCVDCGYAAHACALDFDHVLGEKSFNIGEGTLRSPRALVAELAKCVVRCSNCHRVATMARR